MKDSPVEKIKKDSKGLRGSIPASLQKAITGAISEDDVQVIKFHGMYQQDDRDRREVRAAKKLDRLYSFMIRLRLPGGDLTPEQWIATHHIAGEHSTGVIKITTRQTIQLHGILKSHIKPTIQAFNQAALDSIATCGDVNRNVAAASHPLQSHLQTQIHAYADKLSTLLMPKTRAYYELWLDDELLAEKSEDDPLYQDRYLPRKFKIGIAIPPNNDVDVLTNDIGLIAIIEKDELIGFNIAIGGGLSATHGNEKTYPRLATVIGFCEGEEQTVKAVYEVLTVQRDFGNRSDRKLARLKYTIDAHGVEWFKQQVEARTGFTFAPARPYTFTERHDYLGWHEANGLWHYTVLVENGRVTDDATMALKTALYQIAETGVAGFRFTSNQNLILTNIKAKHKSLVDEMLQRFHVRNFTEQSSGLRQQAMACVAFNTCPLALAEAQRYLPGLITRIEPLLKKYRLEKDGIIMRMTGCPNGCGRPYAAEIGFVGTAYGYYNLHIGGDRAGTRLNIRYREHINEEQILAELDALFSSYQQHKKIAEQFGDFAFRYILQDHSTAQKD